MPTYEYACKQCGEHLEVVQRFTDDALTECPSCTGPLRKVFGSIGISFKGSGFYKNDSRVAGTGAKKDPAASEGSSSDSDTSSPKADASAKSDSGKSDSGKSDSGKSDSGKSDSGKSDSGKKDGGKKGAGTSTAAAS